MMRMKPTFGSWGYNIMLNRQKMKEKGREKNGKYEKNIYIYIRRRQKDPRGEMAVVMIWNDN